MWGEYLKKQIGRKPRKQLVDAVLFLKSKETALDLGSGNFIECKFLVQSGFKKIIAIDSAPEAKEYTKNLSKKIFFKNISFNKYNYPKNSFDLINSQFSLHLYGQKGFPVFIKRIINSLKPGGIFVGQFLGVKDSWNKDLSSATHRAKYVFHTKKEALELLSSLKIIKFTEEDKDGKTILGAKKHWHVFYFIAKKL
ncbi:MAG: class I SAM-dependent methyltransferase [Candidatus Pacebacteria bacterium]|nr:class I SAM-dependent methyltransferase [Candidatus Paceibacterota bacterium]MBP9839993.1 class I SAM-dependent methyltransferase [Candidatus Paceibacterota bacterium]